MKSFRDKISHRIFYYSILALLLCGALVGCSILGGSNQTGGDRTRDKTRREADDGSDGKGVAGDSDPSGEGESSLEPLYFGEPLDGFSCPNSPTTYQMGCYYDIGFKTPQFGTWDIEGQGGLLVSIIERLEPGEENLVLNPGEVRIPGVVRGNFSREGRKCTFGQDIDIITHAYGNCDKDVVYLKVITNFTDVNTTMTCCKDDECDDGPFFWNLPVVTYDLELSAANGFMETKEFEGGIGTMTWQLLSEAVPLEPIPYGD